MKKHTYILQRNIFKTFPQKVKTAYLFQFFSLQELWEKRGLLFLRFIAFFIFWGLGHKGFSLNSLGPTNTNFLMPGIDAGADQGLCEGDTVQLDGSFGMGITKITWIVLGGKGTVDDATDTASFYVPTGNINAKRLDTLVIEEDTTGLGIGTQIPLRDTVVFSVYPQIEIQSASPDTSLCAGDSLELMIQLSGTFQQLSWSATLGTFTDADSSETIYISPTITTSSAVDTLTLIARDTTGHCTMVQHASLARLFGPVTINAGPDTTICKNQLLRLSGSLGVDTLSATWSVLSARGIFNNVNRLNAIYTPSPLLTISRRDTLILTINPPPGIVADCVKGADTIIVTIQSPPVAMLDPDTTILGRTTLDIRVNLSRPVETSIWFSKNGLFSFSSTDVATYAPNELGTATSRIDTIVYRGELENEVCPSAFDTMLVTVFKAPIIDRDGDNPLCSRFCLDTIFRNLGQNTANVVVLASDPDPADTCGVDGNYIFKMWIEELGIPSPTDVLDLASLPGSLTFDCDDRGTQEIDIYVTDGFTEVSYCPTTVDISDFFTSCGDRTVSGYIRTPEGEPLQNVEVRVSSEGVIPFPTTTDVNGRYEFTLKTDRAYQIIPRRNTNLENGITTYDILLTNRHILHLEDFTSPFQLIAADVNKSYTVTSFDLSTIRKLILGISQTFPNNVSWRFVDADYIFQNSLNARIENFPERINIPIQTGHLENQNFIAVKVGDPSGDVDLAMDASGFPTAEPRKREEVVIFQIKDLQLVKGQTYEIPFQLLDAGKVAGYQFTLNFEGLELLAIKEGVAQKHHFGQNYKDRSMLTTSWETLSPQKRNSPWFTLRFKADQNGLLSKVLAISSAITPAEAYNSKLEILDVQLQFEPASSGFDLLQNRPNPFSKETLVGFTLPRATIAKLTVLDTQGRVVQTSQKQYPKGYNEINLNFSDFPQGVFYYRLETAFGAKIQKMMHLE